MFMPKKGISVTLAEDNILWLQGMTAAGKRGSLSETLDTLVTQARSGGQVPASSLRSVVGTIDVSQDDPNLEQADAEVLAYFEESLGRPALVRDRPTPADRYGARRGRGRRG
jgi:hypothetical protein